MKTHKRKLYRNVMLPTSLVNDLQKVAKGRTLRNCYYILYVIAAGCPRSKFKNFQSYRPIPHMRFIKMLGGKYNKPLNALLFGGFIERTDEIGVNKCFEYRIAPRYFMDDNFQSVRFSYYHKTVGAEQYEIERSELSTFISNYRQLEIPYDTLYSIVQKKVDGLSIEDYSTDDEVNWTYAKAKVYEIDQDWTFTEHKGLFKKEALLIADQKGKVLVHDGKKIYMLDPDYFIEEQKNFIQMSWTTCIDNLKDESTLYGKRNSTNNRLDTNFTNMSSELYEAILEHNEMEEMDLMNSQPAFLAHVLEESGISGEDVELFKSLTYKDGLYEYFVGDGLDRAQAKKMIFHVLFGKARNYSLEAERFRYRFPTVSEFIQDYKIQHGDNEFAIYLQKIESQLFIDGIYYGLIEKGIPVLTKHDSIAYFRRDSEIVKTLVQNEFDRINFPGKLKTKCFRPIG